MAKEYIEREALLRKLRYISKTYGLSDVVVRRLKKAIDDSLATDVVEVVHGEWLPVSDDDQYEGEYCCSVCNAEEFFPENAPFATFCWQCGAKMDGGRKHEQT